VVILHKVALKSGSLGSIGIKKHAHAGYSSTVQLLQTSLVQGSQSLHSPTHGFPMRFPSNWHVSLTTVSGGNGVKIQLPVLGSHESAVHGLLSSQSIGTLLQSPVLGLQKSFVHKFSSSHLSRKMHTHASSCLFNFLFSAHSGTFSHSTHSSSVHGSQSIQKPKH
jgi:hypothetical protein